MNKICGVLVFSLLFGCAAYAQERRLTYIETDGINSSSMNIISIDAFFQIINENHTKTVFYTDRQFIVQGNTIVYTIDKKGYNNLNDYKDGDSSFRNGESYYFAKELGLKDQQEVDYYKNERFITISDYRDAVRLGFSPVNSKEKGNLYGLISKEDLQKDIRFANSTIYLKYYYGGGEEWLGNTDVDYLASISNGTIKKLNHYNYYIINLPLMAGKVSFLYYAARMCQYTDYADYSSNAGAYSVKNTDAILKRLGFSSIDELVKADNNGFSSSADYYLAGNYKIGKDALEANRTLIKEIETIKQRYNITVPQAILLNYVLKQQKGLPFSTRALINKFKQEYSSNAVFNAQGSRPDERMLDQLFSTIPQLDKLIMYNPAGESFYVK